MLRKFIKHLLIYFSLDQSGGPTSRLTLLSLRPRLQHGLKKGCGGWNSKLCQTHTQKKQTASWFINTCQPLRRKRTGGDVAATRNRRLSPGAEGPEIPSRRGALPPPSSTLRHGPVCFSCSLPPIVPPYGQSSQYISSNTAYMFPPPPLLPHPHPRPTHDVHIWSCLSHCSALHVALGEH